jgi:ubiquinone/menaquinone biosynthesis C-methylase UbiE
VWTYNERVFDEVCRVLKPGGRLLLHEETIPEQASEPNRSLIKILISIVDDIVNLQPLGTNPYNFRSTKEWISFAAKHGFKYSSRRSHTWGISDLLPKVLKSSNRHSRSIGRIFETTGFVFTKI